MTTKAIVEIIVRFYPDTQAIYLFGSYGTEDERPGSDVDLGLLLPYATAQDNQNLALAPLWSELCDQLNRPVDLINLRLANTVFQNEVVNTARVLYSNGEDERLMFEMETLSAYQKLNEERRAVLESFYQSRRAYNV